MKSNDDKTQLLEIYKLHADLADRASQRRGNANRLFASLVIGIFIFLAAVIRFGNNETPHDIVIVCSGILGLILSIFWYCAIKSYQQLNDRKFTALKEIEKELPYSFFTRESELADDNKYVINHKTLTGVEIFLPIIFSLFFIVLIFSPTFIGILKQ